MLLVSQQLAAARNIILTLERETFNYMFSFSVDHLPEPILTFRRPEAKMKNRLLFFLLDYITGCGAAP